MTPRSAETRLQEHQAQPKLYGVPAPRSRRRSSLKVGIMMRAMDKAGGFHAMTSALTREMLELAPDIEFFLLYQNRNWLGTFASYRNAKEILLNVRSKFLWDQLAVPHAASKHRVDVLFNTQFFTPFFSPCPTTMGLQEPAWWTHPAEYSLATRLYQKIALPLSIRKCAHVFPNSTFILEENRSVLGIPIRHATVAYSAADERFQPLADDQTLEAFRRRYELPRKFILVVTRVVHGGQEEDGPLFPGKNPEVAFRAFRRIHHEIGHDLVFAGYRVKEYLERTEGKDACFDRVHFVGQVPFDESHLLYNAAAIVVNPCVYEGCPNTVLQAMACGRPVIVASSGGSADVAAGAALMSLPMDDRHLANQLRRVARNPALQKKMASDSLTRSREFSWRKSADAVLNVLMELGSRRA